MQPFVLFWHRYGNAAAGVRAVANLANGAPESLAGRPVVHGVELDLKWTRTPQGPLLYAWHGPTGRERLRAGAVRRRARAGRLVLIEQLPELDPAGRLRYLVEIKRGHGSAEQALERFARWAAETGLRERVWFAASSLELLLAARRVAPEVPRVLFGATLGDGRVLHKPTTYVLRSLRRHGLAPELGPDAIQWVCPLGLRPASPEAHLQRAAAARAQGLGYLPGRVASRATLEALAATDAPGAFVYAAAEPWAREGEPSGS